MTYQKKYQLKEKNQMYKLINNNSKKYLKEFQILIVMDRQKKYLGNVIKVYNNSFCTS